MVVTIPASVIRFNPNQYTQFLEQFASLTHFLHNKQRSFPASIVSAIPDRVVAEARRFTLDPDILADIRRATAEAINNRRVDFLVIAGQ